VLEVVGSAVQRMSVDFRNITLLLRALYVSVLLIWAFFYSAFVIHQMS
jgi:hypothetical protein